MGSFKAAVIQAAAVGFDLERGLEKVARLAGEASAAGAALGVFPEAFLPAYPRGITFGTVVGDGSTMPAFDTPLGRIGAVICWENYMPLLRMAMYTKGIQIYCAPTADGRETWLSTMRHVALEGRCFVLACNQFTRRSDFPADIPNALAQAPDDVVSAGGSCIISPSVRCSPDRRETERRSCLRTSISTRSHGASSTSTSPATTHAQTCSG